MWPSVLLSLSLPPLCVVCLPCGCGLGVCPACPFWLPFCLWCRSRPASFVLRSGGLSAFPDLSLTWLPCGLSGCLWWWRWFLWLVFLVCLRSGEWSVCAVCPCGGLAASLVASLPLMAVASGLVSVPPDPISGRAVVLSVVWDCGLNWRVSCWRLFCCPCASVGCVGLFIGFSAALCLGGGGGVLMACRRGSVGFRCLGVGCTSFRGG